MTLDKINILMVLGNDGRGGSQAYVMNVVRNIDFNRFNIDIVVNVVEEGGYAQEWESYGCNIYILPTFKILNYYQYKKAWKVFLSKHRYDIIHGHSTNSASIYLKIGKSFGCKTIAHSHSAGYRGNKVEQFAKSIFAKYAKYHADKWFACSDKAAQRLYGDDYKHSSKYLAIPNAICVSKYKFNDTIRKSIRDKHLINDDVKLYGHIGTFSAPKNHKFLLAIFSEIRKQDNNAKLILCGSGYLLDEIKKLVNNLGLDGSVIFTGLVSNVEEYLMAMDTLIFPSLFEGLPTTIIEAQACGLPVALSDTITKDVCLTGLLHYISLSESPQTWAAKAMVLSNTDRNKDYSTIEDSCFNMETSIKQLESVYIDLQTNNN